jgi:hypothetical protein
MYQINVENGKKSIAFPPAWTTRNWPIRASGSFTDDQEVTIVEDFLRRASEGTVITTGELLNEVEPPSVKVLTDRSNKGFLTRNWGLITIWVHDISSKATKTKWASLRNVEKFGTSVSPSNSWARGAKNLTEDFSILVHSQSKTETKYVLLDSVLRIVGVCSLKPRVAPKIRDKTDKHWKTAETTKKSSFCRLLWHYSIEQSQTLWRGCEMEKWQDIWRKKVRSQNLSTQIVPVLRSSWLNFGNNLNQSICLIM